MTSLHDENIDADIRVERLEKALIRHDGIVIAELDGFITALCLLPQEAPAESWLPVVFGWGKEGDIAPDPDLAKLIAGHYNGVAYELRSGTYQPVYMAADDEADETIIWEPWIEGFAAVIGLYPDAFQALMDGKDDASEAFQMLVGLAAVAMGDDTVLAEMGEDMVAELNAAAPDLIPECVHAVYDAKLEAAGALEPRRVTTVGRNDPCPCGSGKKYKKCCGAAD